MEGSTLIIRKRNALSVSNHMINGIWSTRLWWHVTPEDHYLIIEFSKDTEVLFGKVEYAFPNRVEIDVQACHGDDVIDNLISKIGVCGCGEMDSNPYRMLPPKIFTKDHSIHINVGGECETPGILAIYFDHTATRSIPCQIFK